MVFFVVFLFYFIFWGTQLKKIFQFQNVTKNKLVRGTIQTRGPMGHQVIKIPITGLSFHEFTKLLMVATNKAFDTTHFIKPLTKLHRKQHLVLSQSALRVLCHSILPNKT